MKEELDNIIKKYSFDEIIKYLLTKEEFAKFIEEYTSKYIHEYLKNYIKNHSA